MHRSRRTFLKLLTVAGLAAPLAGRAQAETLVAGPQDLAAALAGAAPGTVLHLAPGTYGALAFAGGGRPGAPITLRPADPDRPPRFDRLRLEGARHVVLEGLHFDYAFAPGDPEFLRPFALTGCEGIAIRAALFDGDRARGPHLPAGGHAWAFGLVLENSRAVTVEGCEIRLFQRGIVVSDCRDLAIRGNVLHGLHHDGMDFAQVQQVRIEDNVIRDFNREEDSSGHSDMIQFWTRGTNAPSQGIVIRNNLLSSGTGWFSQSIFMRNEMVDTTAAGREMYYRDVLIEQNVILNAHLHGITVGETDGLVIRNNTLVRNRLSEGKPANDGLWTPRINVAPNARNVRIERNVVWKVSGWENQPDWVVGANYAVQDQGRGLAGFYAGVFSGDPADPAGFTYRRGGPLDGAGLGADRLQPR